MEKRVFKTQGDTARALAAYIAEYVEKGNDPVNIALSGGSTPAELFSILAEKYSRSIDWGKVRFFWVDERCVPPDHSESNYRMTAERLLSRVSIPDENVFRIKGEDNPRKEAERYSSLIKSEVREEEGLPAFDIILLGMGSDGHTASIFPDQLELLKSGNICEVAIHPETRQKRITLTGPVINRGRSIVFLICGSGKKDMLGKVLQGDPLFPASHVNPDRGEMHFYLDESASPD